MILTLIAAFLIWTMAAVGLVAFYGTVMNRSGDLA